MTFSLHVSTYSPVALTMKTDIAKCTRLSVQGMNKAANNKIGVKQQAFKSHATF